MTHLEHVSMRMASDGLCSGSVKSSSPRAGDPSRPSPSLAWSSVVHLQRSVEQDIKTDSLASSQPNRLRGDDRWEPLPKVSADDSCPFQLPPRPVFGHTTSSVLTLPLICLSHARDRLPMGLQSSVPPHAVLLVRPDGELSGAVSSVTAGTDGRSSPRAEISIPSSQPLRRRPTQPWTHHRMVLMPSRLLRELTRPSL